MFSPTAPASDHTTKVASAIPDQVKYSIIKERKPSLQVNIPIVLFKKLWDLPKTMQP